MRAGGGELGKELGDARLRSDRDRVALSALQAEEVAQRLLEQLGVAEVQHAPQVLGGHLPHQLLGALVGSASASAPASC